MCGIVGYVGRANSVPFLIEGLHRLEYRGYDSAGVAVATSRGVRTLKRAGKVRELEGVLPKRLRGTLGIAHTRWATHGVPNDTNAHPHCDAAQRIAVVHNGIIENAATLRAQLLSRGHELVSDTDTELLAHLIAASTITLGSTSDSSAPVCAAKQHHRQLLLAPFLHHVFFVPREHACSQLA